MIRLNKEYDVLEHENSYKGGNQIVSVYVKGNRWYIDYYYKGVRKRESVGPTDKITRSLAEKALKSRIGEIVQGKYKLEEERKPEQFRTLLGKYLVWAKDNHRSYQRDVTISKSLEKFFKGKFIDSINSWHVEKYKSKRKSDGLSLSSINRELTVLKRIFNLGIEWKLAQDNPVQGVKFFKIPLQKPRALTEEEFRLLFNSASDHLKPILFVAISTGMRKGEILNLRWKDINLEEKYIVVRDSKNYESRIIPINNRLEKVFLEIYRNAPEDEYLFCYHDKKPIEYIYRSFHTALKKSGIRKCTFHSLRHSFATRAVMAGVDIVTLNELLGHKTIAMTMRYSHPTPEHKKKAVDLIGIDTYTDTSFVANEKSKQAVTRLNIINKGS
ncbi:MAG: tyrosine-type recombinase/integrase [Thermodesulfobacteriota bacterium]